MKTARIVAALAASTCIIALAAPAHAQERNYNIPAGSLKAALEAFGRQSGRPIIFKADEVRGARSQGYRGSAPAEDALAAVLSGTGFIMRSGEANSIAIVRMGNGQSGGSRDSTSAESNDKGATPEILVVGKREWTLNTDIRRTRDDAQPYVVFDREQIQRSGATTLEDFFRDYLNSNTGGGFISTQSGTSAQNGTINLRGLGTSQTVVLVDGRRIAPLKLPNSGTIDQPNISGIPLAAIERVEVLASSASGIYGGSATGGVVNIILKRDYRGLDVSASYGGTYDGGAENARVDLSAGTSLWGGRTNVMLTASWQKTRPLLFGQRDWFADRRAEVFGRDPTIGVSNGVPLGATPNIRSSNGAILTLDPAYGGGSLGSAFTYVPYGYRGVGLDGVAPLVANAGRFNLDLPNTVQATQFNVGRQRTILNGAETFAANLAIRQQITPWLKAFVEVAGNQNSSFQNTDALQLSVTLPGAAPNNPFQQAITVAIPQVGAATPTHMKSQEARVTGGLIANLPFGWQGSADYSWDRTWFSYDVPKSVTSALLTGQTNGSVDVLKDLNAYPINYTYGNLAGFSDQLPSTATTASLRLAGPFPVKLPGGRPTITIQAQRVTLDQPGSRSFTSGASSATGQYNPPRKQTTDSVYAEARFPLFGPANNIPFINELELGIAGRYERYKIVGANNSVTCFTFNRDLVAADLDLPCPPTNVAIPIATSENSSINPTYSLRWKPAPDLMLRGSFATGYRGPDANQLIRSALGPVIVAVTDPERGNERIGQPFVAGLYLVNGYSNGNASVKPERSRSFTAGAVLTPRGIPNLRLSADWTRIDKRDSYFSPINLVLSAVTQPDFEAFLAAHPERVVRGPATGGYSVGPITSLDVSYVNLSRVSAEAIDFAADYSTRLGRGTLDFSLAATWQYDVSVQITDASARTQYAGVAESGLGNGSPEWKGNATIRYSTDDWSFGVRARYIDGYWINTAHSYNLRADSNSVSAQTAFDVFGSYNVLKSTVLSAGIRNVFNTDPTFSPNGLFYSPLSDPRGASFYLTISRKF